MKKRYITWGQVFDAIKDVRALIQEHAEEQIVYLYGIPTAGAWIVGLLYSQLPEDVKPNVRILNRDPLTAKRPRLKQTYIIDDLFDSGKTLLPYLEKDFHCHVLFRKVGKLWKALTKRLTTHSSSFSSDCWLVFPWEKQGENAGPHDAVIRLIEYIGDDVHREGLLETPQRVIRSYKDLFAGYDQDPKSVLKQFDQDTPKDGIVLMKNIEFFSTCEHHMLPFWGKAHVAYIPAEDGSKVVGASKLARLFEIYARRLQIQERIGFQVAKDLEEHLNAVGAACVIEAKHMCMCARGVSKQSSKMVTSAMLGAFREKVAARNELMFLINND